MKKEYETNEELLTLGQIHIEKEEQEKKQKRLILPIILMILGLTLMLIGYFFEEITTFLGLDFNNIKVENNQIVENDLEKKVLKCTKKEEDSTLGIKKVTVYEYTFKNKQLQSLNERRTIESLENSDIGPDNIKIIYGKYADVITLFEGINGIKIIPSYKNNKIDLNITIDYSTLDITKIPQNSEITINDKFNEEYRNVKQKITKDKNILCE